MKYISLDTIFASMSRELSAYAVSTGEVINWCGEALEAIQSPSVYQPAIAFTEVVGHQCILPKHRHVILQIARNNHYTDPVLASEVVTHDPNVEPVDIPVALDSNGTPINAYELAYYRPYFDLLGNYNVIGGLPRTAHFTPVRLANHTFFNTVVAKEEGFDGIYSSCTDEYTIVEDILRFSFETGQVAISYLRQKLDCETGYPMIVDNFQNIQAVQAYVRYKLKQIDFYENRQGSETRYAKAEQDWQWYCRGAKNTNMMPQTIDEWENFIQQSNYIMPQTNRYYGFFGKLSHAENRNLIDHGRK